MTTATCKQCGEPVKSVIELNRVPTCDECLGKYIESISEVKVQTVTAMH